MHLLSPLHHLQWSRLHQLLVKLPSHKTNNTINRMLCKIFNLKKRRSLEVVSCRSKGRVLPNSSVKSKRNCRNLKWKSKSNRKHWLKQRGRQTSGQLERKPWPLKTKSGLLLPKQHKQLLRVKLTQHLQVRLDNKMLPTRPNTNRLSRPHTLNQPVWLSKVSKAHDQFSTRLRKPPLNHSPWPSK